MLCNFLTYPSLTNRAVAGDPLQVNLHSRKWAAVRTPVDRGGWSFLIWNALIYTHHV
jgi:hypothetical protein